MENIENYKWPLTHDELYELYINQNLSTDEIGELFNVSKFAVKGALDRRNIHKPKELSNKKRMETNIKKYGYPFPVNSEEGQKKTKETWMEKYGTDNPMKNKDIRAKAEATNLEKYGYKSPCQSEEIKEKSKQTCLERYNVVAPGITDEAKEKRRLTCLEKYGTTNFFEVKEINDKRTATMLEKYGVEHQGKSPIIREKTRQTNLERYGCENPTQNKEVQEKIKQTNLEKYGCENPAQNSEIHKKIMQTLEANNMVATSSQQKNIYNILKDIYQDNVTLNKICHNLFLDIALEISNKVKIDIEYDGWYFHRTKEDFDRRRDYFVKSQGYKVLRIRSVELIPTQNELLDAINELIDTDIQYKILKLPDWDISEAKYQKRIAEQEI